VTRWEHQFLGSDAFPAGLSSLEISQFFTLDPPELAAVRKRRGPNNQLAVALQVGFLKMTGGLLNSTDLIPSAVLEHVGGQLHAGPAMPFIASIRALYRKRQRTLFDHQQAAMQVMGFEYFSANAKPHLISLLRKEAVDCFDLNELIARARAWVHEHQFVLPTTRNLRSLAVAARKWRDDAVLEEIQGRIDETVRDQWLSRLLEIGDPATGATRMDWLRDGPRSKRPHGLTDQVEKIEFLKGLGADQLTMNLSLAGLQHYARHFSYRKPAALARMSDARFTLEAGCFLRLQLLRQSDRGLEVLDHRIADLWRGAKNRVEARQAEELRFYRGLVSNIHALLGDEAIPAELFRDKIRLLLDAAPSDGQRSKAATIRRELASAGPQLRDVLDAGRRVGLKLSPEHPLNEAFKTIDMASKSGAGQLPDGQVHPFGPTWSSLIDQVDRVSAFRSYVAATVMLLKRSLRNGSAAVDHSLNFTAPEKRLIPHAEWSKDRRRHLKALSVSGNAQHEIKKLEASLEAGLQALDEAVAAGKLRIENDQVRLPKIKAQPEDPRLPLARRTVFGELRGAQLPDVLIQIDARTRFSWRLLGRTPRSESELVTLYAALVALGSDLTPADLVRMIPNAAADSIGQMMVRLEARESMEKANATVLSFMRQHSVVKLWGPALGASADMMSLEASRHLWSARAEPRRRVYAVGTYAHVLDQWGIIYDQPIVLNKRQAGAAIEGALRQNLVDLERLAVDTHGFTHFGMAVAKIVGVDLCPRLADIKDRKLYMPRGIRVPDRLRPIVSQTVAKRAIIHGWDDLLRVGASVKSGRCSAPYIVERYGSAGRGDTVFKAGDAFGKLLRTLYLCDYLSNENFRSEILTLLNQGESVHTLERAVHNGNLGPKRGRTTEQLTAISGALSLLTNILMTWNTMHIERRRSQRPEALHDDLLKHIAPVAHGHFNMRGIFTFDLGQHRPALLGLNPFDAFLKSPKSAT